MTEVIDVRWSPDGELVATRPADLHGVAHVAGLEIAVWGWSATPLDVDARAAVLLALGHATRRLIDAGAPDLSRLSSELLAWLFKRPELTHALVRVR